MTDDIVNNPIDLHTTNTMLDQHPDVRDPLIIGFLLLRQCTFGWLLLGLQDEHPRQREALKATILPQHAAFRQPILGLVRDPFIVRFAFVSGAQKPYRAGCIDDDHILDRVVLLLAAVIDFLLIGIFRSCYRSFRSIVAKKGALPGRQAPFRPASGRPTQRSCGLAASSGWPRPCSGCRATAAPTY